MCSHGFAASVPRRQSGHSEVMPQRGYFQRDGKLTRAGFMHVYRRPRHKMRIVLRELPLAECFHRWYVLKQVRHHEAANH